MSKSTNFYEAARNSFNKRMQEIKEKDPKFKIPKCPEPKFDSD